MSVISGAQRYIIVLIDKIRPGNFKKFILTQTQKVYSNSMVPWRASFLP